MFSANITGGGLLLQESRILAEQLLAGRRADELLSVSLAQNLLQKHSPATTKKMVGLIIPRLKTMDQRSLAVVVRGDKAEASLLLLAAIAGCHRLVGDFLVYISRECIARYKPAVTFHDWEDFFAQCVSLQPDMEKWSAATVQKLRNVIFRLLVESGVLEGKSYRILPLYLPDAVREYLASPQREYARTCMEGLL